MLEQSQLDRALEAYEKVLSLDPNNGDACVGAARVYSFRGKIPETIKKYMELMRIYQESENYKQALDVAGWIRRIQPENDEARLNSIMIYQKMNDIESVVKASVELAGLYTELGRGEDSLSVLKKAQDYAPGDLAITMKLADISMSQGQINEAASYYRVAAEAYLQNKDFEKSLDAFRRIKVLIPNDIQLLLILGNLYYMLNRLDEAEVEYRRAFALDLNNVDALMAFGSVCQMKGNMRNALLAFDKILQINTSDIVALEKLGEINQTAGNTQEAIRNYLLAASANEQMDEPEHAIRLYQRVLKMDPTNPTATRELTNMGAPFDSSEPDEFIAFKPNWDIITGINFNVSEISEPAAVEQPSAEAEAPGLSDINKTTLDPIRIDRKGKKSENKNEKDSKSSRSSKLLPKESAGKGRLIAKGLGGKKGMSKPVIGGSDEEEEETSSPMLRSKKTGGKKGGKPMLSSSKPVLSRKKHSDEDVHEEEALKPEEPMQAAPEAPGLSDASLFAPPSDSAAAGGDASLFAPPSGGDASLFAPPSGGDAPLFAPPSGGDASLFAPPSGGDASLFAPPSGGDASLFAPPSGGDASLFAPPSGGDAPLFAPPSGGDASLFAPPSGGDAPLFAPPSGAPGDGELLMPDFGGDAPQGGFGDFGVGGFGGAENGAGFASGGDQSFGQGEAPAFGDQPFGQGEAPAFGDQPFGQGEAPAFGDQPFGQGEAPAFGDQPFGQGEAPAFGDQPFGQSEAPAFGDQPFGQSEAQSPFGDQPFGQSDSPAPFGDQPFGQGEAQSPFGDQPFGQSDSPAPFGDQPFGQSDSPAPFGDQPFGQNDSPAPFGAGSSDSSMFAPPDAVNSGADSPAFGDMSPFGEAPGFGDVPSFGDVPAFGEVPAFGDAPGFGEFAPAADLPEGFDNPLGEMPTSHFDGTGALSGDPFAAISSSGDPFGAAPSGDPFGAASSGDPFGAASTGDPFGAASSGDPFGGVPSGDPFGGVPSGDPFGGVPSGDPFGAVSSGDPFGTAPSAVADESPAATDSQSSPSFGGDVGEIDLPSPDMPVPSMFGMDSDFAAPPSGSPSSEPSALAPESPAEFLEPSLSAAAPEQGVADVGGLDSAKAEPESIVSDENPFGSETSSSPFSQEQPAPASPDAEPDAGLQPVDSSEIPTGALLTMPSITTAPEDIPSGSMAGIFDNELFDKPDEPDSGSGSDTGSVKKEAPSAADLINQLPPVAKLTEIVRTEPEEAPVVNVYQQKLDAIREKKEADDIAAAVELYENLLSDNPGNMQLRDELADLYYSNGLYDGAVEQYSILAEKDPDRIDYFQRLAMLGIWGGDIASAEKSFLAAARIYRKNKESALAVDFYQSVLSVNSANVDARDELVDIYIEQSLEKAALYHLNILADTPLDGTSPERAIDILKKIQDYTDREDIRLKLAFAYDKAERFDEAVSSYRELLNIFRKRNDRKDMTSCLERMKVLTPDDISVYNELAGIYKDEGDMEKLVESRLELGRYYLSKRMDSEAVAPFEEIVSIQPDNMNARKVLVDIFLGEHQYAKAFDNIRILSDLYCGDSRYEDAVELYVSLISEDSGNLEARDNLACVYLKMGDVGLALEQLFFIADAYCSSEDWEGAASVYRRILEISPDDVDSGHKLGSILSGKLMRGEDAVLQFKSVFEKKPLFVENSEDYVKLLFSLKRPAEAMRIVNELIGMDASWTAFRDDIVADYEKRGGGKDSDMADKYTLGIIYKELGKNDEAIMQFQTTKKNYEFFIDSSIQLALCFSIKPGMKGLATKTLSKAIDDGRFSDGDKIEMKYVLAGLFEASGKSKEALSLYKQIEALEPGYKDTPEKISSLNG